MTNNPEMRITAPTVRPIWNIRQDNYKKTSVEKRLMNSKFYQALRKLPDRELQMVAVLIGFTPGALDCVRMYLNTPDRNIQNLAIRVELDRRGLIKE